MGNRIRLGAACGLFLAAAAGCSTIGDTLGISAPAHPLNKNAKTVRDAAPLPVPVPRELAMELLPAHVTEPGDTLLIQTAELDTPVRLPPDQTVQQDGTIDLGKYGRPVVAGKSLAEVEVLVRDAVRAKEKDLDKDKGAGSVTITVRQLARPGNVYYVLGEVNAPGAFPITGNNTVLSAITQAGGPTKRASEQNVILSRPSAPDGCRTVLPVCYTNIVQLGDTTTNYQLRPGDRIYVPGKSTMENLLPARCQKGGPCNGPQVPCFGGGCGAPAGCAPAGGVPQPVAAPTGLTPMVPYSGK